MIVLVRWILKEYSLLSALSVGAALRVYQITDQIVADDEFHALHVALTETYAQILSHFGGADHSIPLSVFYRFLTRNVYLSEMVMRGPSLLVGLGSLAVFPLLVRRRLGKRISDVFAWLCAVSPLMIYFTRNTRPYSLALFFSFIGIWAFDKWWNMNHPGWGYIYVVCAIVGPYFHLSVLPFLLVPLLFLAGAAIKKPSASTLLPLIKTGGLVATGLLVLLGPPLFNDPTAIGAKLAQDSIDTETITGMIQLLSGTKHWWLISLVWSGIILGFLWLCRREAGLVRYLTTLVTLQVVIVLFSGASFIQVPITATRYILPTLPILLLFASIGITQMGDILAGMTMTRLKGLLAVTLIVLLLGFGPLPAAYYSPNNWTNHPLFQYHYDPNSKYALQTILKASPISRFYDQLGAGPSNSLRIVEVPWYYQWSFNAYPYYQKIHQQKMIVGFVDNPEHWSRRGELPAHQENLRFRNFVHVADGSALIDRDVRYVIFHHNLRDEMSLPLEAPYVDVSEWVGHFHEVYGIPIYEDRLITVFDVAETRQ